MYLRIGDGSWRQISDCPLCTKGIVLTKDDMEKEREYESLTETFEKIVLIIYPTLIFPRVLVLSRSAVGKRMNG